MRLQKCFPLSLLLFIADYISPAETKFVPSALQRVHQFATRQTHSLAKDLRLAFGGVLAPRDNSSPPPAQHVVYCKMKQAPFISGPTGGNNTTSAVGGGMSSSTTPTSRQASPTGAVSNSPWKLQQSYSGDSFFQGWDFFIGDDPTNGIVNYVDETTARSTGLLEVNDQGNAIMRVETTPKVDNLRNSVRITTKFQFNGGLVIMDAVHMPTGCGSWPAFWTNANGLDWPEGGEIDIVEGVHDYTNNQATIHTEVGCTLPSTDQGVLAISGSVIGLSNCAAAETGNQGCGIRASSNKSFGASFNNNGGGTYAMKWDTSGIAIYFFPRGSEPADITAGKPEPDSWGTAMARWPAASCDPFKFFKVHRAIFDTTLCGDWAAGVWSSAGIPGQEQSCAQKTGFTTCEEFVRESGSTLKGAYWEVKDVKIYQLQS
ncbi:CAZyme family GH16 [Agaricus bisporus var. burnettii]|uniref:CAZyme family GH16 n=1 Tax=Agaricus bisporus var. burnettii TaxID=192524 RepID=A0A8H7FBA6_AGABI|nr:CAZyme family GH16 [Agaricus bisporus var. burnettii]